LSLDDIAALLDDPGVDRLAHLRRQEQLVRDRVDRLEEMAGAVRLMIEAEHLQLELTPEERFELFGDFDLERFAEKRTSAGARLTPTRRPGDGPPATGPMIGGRSSPRRVRSRPGWRL
jgi:hypothetical protein